MAEKDPHIRMAELTLREPVLGAPPETVALIATQLIFGELRKGAITFVVAFTFRGMAVRAWQLRDIVPVDDVVRFLSQREEAEAVAVVCEIPVPPGIEGDRSFVIAAEGASGKFDNLVVFKQSPQGEMHQFAGRTYDPRAATQWFGVAPEGKLDMWVEGIVGAMTTRRGDRGGSS